MKGVEMGQGINTKVAQCVAYELGIDVDMVKIKAVTAATNPNGATTGGSVGQRPTVLELSRQVITKSEIC